MYFVLSPAKNLNENNDVTFYFGKEYSQPTLMPQACELMRVLKPLEPTDLSALMGISANLAELNAVRNQQWAWDEKKPFTIDNSDTPAKPAVYLFDGDVYTGLDAYNLNREEIGFLNQHLGILSGLYGLLKPLDLMLPYRLEMGTKLKNLKGKDLYQFWGDSITDLINQRMAENDDKVLVNLASNEYFKAVNAKKIHAEIVTPRFEDGKDGKYKVVSFYAKKARGLMVRYACENGVQTVDELKDFDLDGYYFVENASSSTELVFRRDND
ncbi:MULTISPECIES: peroxide stress protein YaaA [unclassified Moraxella]|uniref:peroxide stress protein YaaA n=1 Tax=unclassified Moraxella TaxID=2685852 RepID=UPI003AF8B255